jgi:stearoyl-CoA desaturase (delta-9 desaturase)
LVPRLRRVLYSFGPVLIVAKHLGCLLLFWTGLGIGAALWALALYLVRMLATTAIYHRLITHTSYRAPRPVAWIGAAVAASAGQMGPSWWKAHHLAHHRHVDTAPSILHTLAVLSTPPLTSRPLLTARHCKAPV